MVALLRPQPGSSEYRGPGITSPGEPGQLRLVVDNTDRRRSHRPASSVHDGPVHDGPVHEDTVAPRPLFAVDDDLGVDIDRRSVVVIALLAAIVVFGGLMAVRLVQGSPALGGEITNLNSSAGAAIAESGTPVVGPGDQIVVAQPGDSMWSIAESVAPGSDPRPIVASLIDANGSDSVQIGQQIVIPRQLLD